MIGPKSCAIITATMRAKAKLWLNLVLGYILIALALFLSAGSIHYWQAWVFLGIGLVSCLPLMLYIATDPILLESRTRAGPTSEQRPIQKIIVWTLLPVWIAAFIVPGLDSRLGWSNVPPWLCLVGDMLILVSMWIVYRVFKENSFGSATVEIGKDQRVISTGPYAVVRHPMYTGASLYFAASALALGSYWALVPAILMLLGFVWRLFDEERFLAQNLPSYTAYCAKVRWHLIPGIF